MRIFIGADHRGFELKENLKKFLESEGHEVGDVGADQVNNEDDYVDYAVQVAVSVANDQMLGSADTRGIVICGSGVGVDVVANKLQGIRSGLGFEVDQVKSARADDDINVLALAADFVSQEKAEEMVKVFIETSFEKNEERFVRRLAKIEELEASQSESGCCGGGGCGEGACACGR